MAVSPDETLVETALRMALLGRHPQAGVLFPSDWGAQSTRAASRALEAEVQRTLSLSRTGNENAVTQSFFSTARSRRNASRAPHSGAAHKPGKLSSRTPSASTTGFDDTLLEATRARLPTNH